MSSAAPALQERVYIQIKKRIVHCLMPPGAVIAEEQLAAEFGTSRTPIREALLRLQRENLVVIYPRQGTFVSQISIKDIHAICQIRLLIEPRVARTMHAALDRETILRFRDFFDAKEPGRCQTLEWYDKDRDFHSMIIEACDNRYLTQMYSLIMDQAQRIRILSGRVPQRFAAANREHVEIADALLERDTEKIEQVIAAHIAGSRDAALRLESFLCEREE